MNITNISVRVQDVITRVIVWLILLAIPILVVVGILMQAYADYVNK
jgi:hypothetical protein